MSRVTDHIQSTFQDVRARNPHEAEYLQAVEELLATLEPVLEAPHQCP